MPQQLRADVAAVHAATARLLATADALAPEDPRRPSLLPGWTVGHVLTHLARNADGMVRLVDWAVTDVPTPMYPSMEAREADIEAGSGRDARALAADVRDSAGRLDAALERLAAEEAAYDRLVLFGAPRPGAEPDSPARSLPWARLREVEIHHVDLGLPAYTPADWPAEFVERALLFVHARSGPVDVVGSPADVLAWRLGRPTGGPVLRRDGSDPGPAPAW